MRIRNRILLVIIGFLILVISGFAIILYQVQYATPVMISSFVIGSIILLFALWAGLWLDQSLGHSIEVITRTAVDIAAGDLSQKVTVSGVSELLILGESINRMSKAIRQRMEELTASREDLRITLQSIGDAVISTDANGEVVWMNPVAETLTGWDQNMAQGKALEAMFKILDVENHQPVENPAEIVLRAGQAIGPTNHTVLIGKDGQVRQIADSAAPIRNNEGVVTGVVLVFRDISEQYAKDRALRDSEERLREVLDNSVVALYKRNYLTDAYDYMSPAVLAISGYTSDEMVQMSSEATSKLIYPDDLKVVQEKLNALFANGGGYIQLEYRFYHKSGELRWANDVAHILVDSEGCPLTGIGSLQDITERKRVEEALQKSEERLRRITDNMVDMIAQYDMGPNYVFVSPSFEKILGYSPEDLVGRNAMENLHPDEKLQAHRDIGAMLRMGKGSVQFRYCHKDGSYHWIESTGTLLYNAQGEAIGSIMASRDISDRKRAEEEIYRLNAELEQRVIERTAQLEAANKELEAFAYSVSHDLRAPLRSIDGFSLALLEEAGDQLNEHNRDYLKRVRSSIRHMGQLIDSLLKFSRMTRGGMTHSRLNLSRMAEKLAIELHETQPERSIEWFFARDVMLTGNEELLEVVLQNLLNNAFKFTSHHAAARIEFGVVEQVGQPVYFVRDNGAGFDMKYADKLFGVFQRLHDAAVFEGTGIGLATVQRIIQRHGGHVWAEGEVEKGATFYFTIDQNRY